MSSNEVKVMFLLNIYRWVLLHIIKMQYNELIKEKMGWLSIAEKNLSKLWDNQKDDETWSKYF